MKATKVYTREDIRDLWRRYQHGDMAAGNDFALIAYAQGQTSRHSKPRLSRNAATKMRSRFPIPERQPSSGDVPE